MNSSGFFSRNNFDTDFMNHPLVQSLQHCLSHTISFVLDVLNKTSLSSLFHMTSVDYRIDYAPTSYDPSMLFPPSVVPLSGFLTSFLLDVFLFFCSRCSRMF